MDQVPGKQGEAGNIRVRLVAIGDIAWDILVHPAGELVWGSDTYGTTALLAGGASANVAVWARRLGADAVLVGKIGDDPLGRLMLGHLEDEGVASRVTVSRNSETTRIAIIVRPDGERAFVTDHTRPLRLTADDLPGDLLDGAHVVFLNGYAVFMAGGTAFAQPLLREARRRAIPVAFDPSSFALVERYGSERLLDELGPLDVLLANEDEVRALTGSREALPLLERAGMVVVKQGDRGATATVRQGRSGSHPPARHLAPAVPVTVVDTTGAGDAFDAAFLVEYYRERNVDAALAAGNRIGSRVAACRGAQTAASREGEDAARGNDPAGTGD